jgi:hypothetical protein
MAFDEAVAAIRGSRRHTLKDSVCTPAAADFHGPAFSSLVRDSVSNSGNILFFSNCHRLLTLHFRFPIFAASYFLLRVIVTATALDKTLCVESRPCRCRVCFIISGSSMQFVGCSVAVADAT